MILNPEVWLGKSCAPFLNRLTPEVVSVPPGSIAFGSCKGYQTMTQRAKPIRLTDQSPDQSTASELPVLKIVPLLGKQPLETIESDLTLITLVQGMRIPSSLHAMDKQVGTTIRQTINDQHFTGRRGHSLLFDVPLPGGQSKRNILLAGIGRADAYCGEVACEVFGTLFDKALETGAESVVVPIVPNRATSGCVNIRSTVIKLRRMLAQKIAAHDGPVKLKEVQFYCTPQAKRQVQLGIDHVLPTRPATGCDCGD